MHITHQRVQLRNTRHAKLHLLIGDRHQVTVVLLRGERHGWRLAKAVTAAHVHGEPRMTPDLLEGQPRGRVLAQHAVDEVSEFD